MSEWKSAPRSRTMRSRNDTEKKIPPETVNTTYPSMRELRRRNGKWMPERVSYGIACVRVHNSRHEMLLIKKRCTYAFLDFARGNYNSSDSNSLIKLFSSMTLCEQCHIVSLDFSYIWYKAWLCKPINKSSYFVPKTKFENAFLVDGGTRLRQLIEKSAHVDTIWEIPKGKKSAKNEPNIICAVREFYEETGIDKDQYYLLPGKTYSYSFVDDGVKYKYIYYIAVARTINISGNYNNINDPQIRIKKDAQLLEVEDVRWMNTTDMKYYINPENKKLIKMVNSVFRCVKNYQK